MTSRQFAMLLMIAAFLCFSILDASAKYLQQQGLPIPQIVWFRFLCQFAIASGWIALTTRRFIPSRPALQLFRSSCLMGATFFNFTALTVMQLAEVNAVAFSAPLFVAILAIPILGERIGPRRWAAIIIGFAGVLLVLKPGTGALSVHDLFAIGFVLCLALYQITTRLSVQSTSLQHQFFYASVMGAVVFLVPGLRAWEMPVSWHLWAVMLMMGATATIGHYWLIKAHELAPAPVLAPFIYVQMVFMVAAGYWVFGQWPDEMVFLGAGIIIATSAYMWHRERHRPR